MRPESRKEIKNFINFGTINNKNIIKTGYTWRISPLFFPLNKDKPLIHSCIHTFIHSTTPPILEYISRASYVIPHAIFARIASIAPPHYHTLPSDVCQVIRWYYNLHLLKYGARAAKISTFRMGCENFPSLISYIIHARDGRQWCGGVSGGRKCNIQHYYHTIQFSLDFPCDMIHNIDFSGF